MNVWLAKAGTKDDPYFVPGDDDAMRIVRRMGLGELVLVTIVRPRSVQWHRLYFGMCRVIGQNQDPQRDEDSIDNELRILGGHYDVMHVAGYEVRVPKRIAFSRLTADEWAALFPSLDLAAKERFGIGSDDLRNVA
jgi:hypothetical protein